VLGALLAKLSPIPGVCRCQTIDRRCGESRISGAATLRRRLRPLVGLDDKPRGLIRVVVSNSHDAKRPPAHPVVSPTFHGSTALRNVRGSAGGPSSSSSRRIRVPSVSLPSLAETERHSHLNAESWPQVGLSGFKSGCENNGGGEDGSGEQAERSCERMRSVLLVSLIATSLALAPAASPAPPPPHSIAGIGDSITRATDVCCWYGDHPAQSWSTGGGAFDGIRSHYERIRTLNPAIYGRNYNDARAGARMRDAQSQAQTAVTQGARYVTIFMGANDVCTSSPSTMTSVTDFRAQFSATMSVLASGLPAGLHVFVVSIPNIYRLWQLFRADATAQFVWSVAQICQAMLSPFNTEQVRQAVLAREQAFNQVLAEVCAQYAAICRFDDNAVFNYSFSTSQVSKLDYFHPSLAGQAALAAITWQRSWWAT
jgi:lysophospholipase L1-like esterase